MSELDSETRAQVSRHLGMKPSEVVAVAGVPYGDGDDTGAVVETHDGTRWLIAPDAAPGEVERWDGPMPGAPVEVAEVEDPAEIVDENPDDTPTTGGDDGVPSGTADEVLTWVGDDRDRATQALQAEQAGPKRSTLIAKLEKLAGLA